MSGDVTEMSTEIPGLSHAEVPDPHVPHWLELSVIVMAGCAGYTLLAYLLWLWAS